MESKMVAGVEVKANDWEKGSQHRIYFSDNSRGKACWDVNAQTWIPSHMEFGARFKDEIMKVFGLQYK